MKIYEPNRLKNTKCTPNLNLLIAKKFWRERIDGSDSPFLRQSHKERERERDDAEATVAATDQRPPRIKGQNRHFAAVHPGRPRPTGSSALPPHNARDLQPQNIITASSWFIYIFTHTYSFPLFLFFLGREREKPWILLTIREKQSRKGSHCCGKENDQALISLDLPESKTSQKFKTALN